MRCSYDLSNKYVFTSSNQPFQWYLVHAKFHLLSFTQLTLYSKISYASNRVRLGRAVIFTHPVGSLNILAKVAVEKSIIV